MRVEQILVANLLVIVSVELYIPVAADSPEPTGVYAIHVGANPQNRYNTPFLKENEKQNGAFKVASIENSERDSGVIMGEGTFTESSRGGHLSDKEGTPRLKLQQVSKAAEKRYLVADYGILGNSDDEDSSKWAAEEIRKVPLRPSKSDNLIPVQQRKENAAIVRNATKAVTSNTNISQSRGVEISKSEGLKDHGPNGSVTSNKTTVKALHHNGTFQTPHHNLQSTVDQPENPLFSSNTIGNQARARPFIENVTAKTPAHDKAISMQYASNDMSLEQGNRKYAQNVTDNEENGVQGNNKTAQESKTGNSDLESSFFNNIAGNETTAKPFVQNSTMKTLAMQQLIANNGQLQIAQSSVEPNRQSTANGNKDKETMAHEAIQIIASGNAAAGTQKIKGEINATSAGPILPQSNQVLNSNMISSKISSARKKETHDHAPSLSINLSSLRSGQSFDLQMPPSMSSKVSFEDNHFHISPQNASQPSEANISKYLKDLRIPSANSHFLNLKTNERQPNTLLQRLNSDIVDARAEPLTNGINSDREVSHAAFQEEPPAGRTFADKVLEASMVESPLNQKEKLERESQREVQEDENLARALNASSVSSIIYSANQALFDSDKDVFSKKSAREKTNSKPIKPRDKRSRYLRRLVEHRPYLQNELPSKRKRKLHHPKATPRQVINLGNHYLWFGAQNSVDANGYPRQNTAAGNPQYNVRRNTSNFLDSEKEVEDSVETKGYKALQNALSSMEFTQEGQGDSDFHYGIPSVNKYWQDAHQEQIPTRVLIQDDNGKEVYQGLVHISKLNQTTSGSNVISAGITALNALSGHENKQSDTADDATTANINKSDQNTIAGGNQQDNNGNQNSTRTPNGAGLMRHVENTNSTDYKQNQSQEMQTLNQSESRSNSNGLQNTSSDTQPTGSVQGMQQPSVFVKQLTTSPFEPETYHVIVRDEGKKITNEKGQVTVIISGPTAKQATIGPENTMLIPQTDNPQLFAENPFNDNSGPNKDQGISSHRNESMPSTLSLFSKPNDSLFSKPNDSLQENVFSALKVSEGIEKQFGKGKNPKAPAMGINESKSESEEEPSMQEQHHFVQIGQDLKEDVDGLQMEEVSRPDIQEEQHQEKENLLAPVGGEYLDKLGKPLGDVPTLNIVLDPTHKIGGSLSVGGKVVPISSAAMQETQKPKQQLDCHTDPKNRKRTLTVLTCHKKQSLTIFPQSMTNEAYLGNQEMSSSSPLQLDQVMNVLNNQVKATINKEMKFESKDIQNILTGMSLPSSTLMDIGDDYPDSEPPERSEIGPDESFTSTPIIEKQHRPFNHRRHHFGNLPHLGFFNHFGMPHRRHYWRNHHHSNPIVVMAHKDHDEGFWDYQHNIFIPRESNFENSDDDEEESKDKEWEPWNHQGHRRGSWFIAHPPFRNPPYSPSKHHDLFHLRLPTIFGRSGPWKPSMFHTQERGAKRTAVVHKTIRGDRDLCKPIIDGPSPPFKGEWEYLGRVLSSCPCRQSDSEW
ncbi:homeobox protein 5-like [Montipora capricornis]|uniref:homeobox protein 5-like n=1 Tax=Montipora capricornis TaxID=246305 RepID=UPI0035F1AFBF